MATPAARWVALNLFILFDLKKYRRALDTQWLGRDISYFEELDSTNTYLKQLPAEEISHGQLCLADNQVKGRGQYERNWETDTGKNLTFTLVFRPIQADRFHILTLACARAAVDQIEESIGCKAFIKWPNDVLINNKKVAGLLTETVFNGNKLDRLMIGIGLNVNQDHFSSGIKNKAISLKQIKHQPVDREQFLCRFLSRVEFEYMRWHKQNDDLLRSINQKIIGYGQWVRFKINGHNQPAKYKLLGINENGQLTAIDEEGGLKTFSYEQIRLITD